MSQICLPVQDWRKATELIPRHWQQAVEKLKKAEHCLKWLDVLPLVAETEHLYRPESGWDLTRNMVNESD